MKVEVESAPATLELGTAVIELIQSIRDALDDGWQPIEDIPDIVAASVKTLAPLISQMGELQLEYENDKEGFYGAAAVIFKDLLITLSAKG